MLAQISQKNLQNLQEALDQEALASKKSAQYATMVCDPGLQDMANHLAQHHKDRYNTLLQYLTQHT